VIAYAAIDLRGGRVVQLIGGLPERERLSLPDPVAVARRFAEQGFGALHVVDLDAAFQHGSNAAQVEAIIDAVDVPVQVGGGVRDDGSLQRWLDAGAARVIVGTRAINDPDWLAAAARRHPERLVVAADLRDDVIVTHGWTRSSGLPLGDFLAGAGTLPLAGLLVTDVGREGRLEGVDGALFARLAAATRLPVIAAGGIGSLQDLYDLAGAGVAGAVIGTALYTGAVEPRLAAQEFNP
jgi:phosphoribosylformimino-5-aminoimidazole carboxamide ribotide isomerase